MPVFFRQYTEAAITLAILAQTATPTKGQQADAPRVVFPTAPQDSAHQKSASPSARSHYPWKTYVTATIFWCGEQPTARNPTPNCKSSWDTEWASNFGGYDDPNPSNRLANHATGEFRPKNFIPKLNPFYIALPYNDVKGWNTHKPEASKVIPWFTRLNPNPGKTVLKGRWLQIYVNKRSCYAQWEDCGPWVTDDWQYVFGSKAPKNSENGKAGIDLSPSIRDYLGVKSGEKVHWRFVEESQVPYGPWRKYGSQIEPQVASTGDPDAPRNESQSQQAQRKYIEYLRKLRDEQFMKKPLSEL